MPGLYMTIAREIFFPDFFGRGGGTCTSLPAPVSYACLNLKQTYMHNRSNLNSPKIVNFKVTKWHQLIFK